MTAWLNLPGDIKLSALAIGFVVCCLTWMLVLLGHGYLKYGNEFRIVKWFKENINTLVVGVCITLGLALIRGFTKDVGPLLDHLGLEAGKPGVAITIGFIIASFLLGVRGKLTKKNEENKT
jgi:hypothetical protein